MGEGGVEALSEIGGELSLWMYTDTLNDILTAVCITQNSLSSTSPSVTQGSYCRFEVYGKASHLVHPYPAR